MSYQDASITQAEAGPSRLDRWAGASGIGTVLLLAAANAVWGFQQPARGASPHELLAFYTHVSTRIVVGASLTIAAIVPALVFVSALRGLLAELDGSELWANVAFAGFLIGGTGGLGAETINMAAALRGGDGQLTRSLSQALFDVSWILGYNAAGVGIAAMIIATSTVALRLRLLMPRWLAAGSLLLGLGLVTPLMLLTPIARLLLLAGFGWILMLGVLLSRGTGIRAIDPPP